MRYKGINYDTGTTTTIGGITRETFDKRSVTEEIKIIRDELHCNSIRISGIYIDRVAMAAEIASKMGLAVWFSPSLQYDNQENTLQFMLRAAESAQTLRRQYPSIVLVVGCELSLFTSGFVKGDTGEERIKNLFSPLSLIKNLLGLSRTYNKRLNRFLSAAVKEIRQKFNGEITYASGTWERVNWDMFDIISADLYRSSYNKKIYLQNLRKYNNTRKRFVVTEFGCCTYRGADDKGAIGWAIVDWKKDPPQLTGDYKRDESVQAAYLKDLLGIFQEEKVEGAFVFTFISCKYFYNSKPQYDLDMAAFGIVRAIEETDKESYRGLAWVPKKAFFELANYYGDL